MRAIKSLPIALVLLLISGLSGTVWPAEKQVDAGTEQTSAPVEMTDGVVRKVDRNNNKITIKHGEIKNLDMPAMSMVFQVKRPDLLDKVQAGDKVKFRAEKSGSAFVVTDIQPER